MSIRIERGTTFAQKGTLILAMCGLMLAGCGRTNDRLKQAYQDAALAKVPVAPVSGIVTVDGLAPAPFTLVMLWDPKKPSANVLRTICDSEGRFAFTSYEGGDGVPPGTYVVLVRTVQHGKTARNLRSPRCAEESLQRPRQERVETRVSNHGRPARSNGLSVQSPRRGRVAGRSRSPFDHRSENCHVKCRGRLG